MSNKADLLTTAELIDAIMSRFDTLVFCAAQDRKDASGGEGLMLCWRRKGDHHRAIGLAHTIIQRCQDEFDDSVELASQDDL